MVQIAVARRRLSRTSMKRNASQFAGAPGSVPFKSRIRVYVKLAGLSIMRDGGIELPRVKRLEPRAKPRKLARGEQIDGFRDVRWWSK